MKLVYNEFRSFLQLFAVINFHPPKQCLHIFLYIFHQHFSAFFGARSSSPPIYFPFENVRLDSEKSSHFVDNGP